MLAPYHRRLTARIALFAMLLLALAPSVSRLLATPSAGESGWAELCTLQGIKWVKLPSAQPSGPATPAPRDRDCDYCPLLQSLDAATVLLWQPPTSILADSAPDTIAVTPPARWAYPSGLGSRGPPTLG